MLFSMARRWAFRGARYRGSAGWVDRDSRESAGYEKKSQTIVAWKGFADNAEKTLKEKEERVRQLLESGSAGHTVGATVESCAQVSRSLIRTHACRGIVESWEEAVDAGGRFRLDTGYGAGGACVERGAGKRDEGAFARAFRLSELGEFGVQLLHGVSGKRKNGSVFAVRAGKLARAGDGDHFGGGNRVLCGLEGNAVVVLGRSTKGVAVLSFALSDVERARESSWVLVAACE